MVGWTGTYAGQVGDEPVVLKAKETDDGEGLWKNVLI